MDPVLHISDDSGDTSAPVLLPQPVQLADRLRQVTPLPPVAPRPAAPAEQRIPLRDEVRIRLAWAKLLWLLTFLGVLLALTYLVPHMVEQIQYASSRGRQRAEHELAKAELQGEPLAQLSRASQLVSQRVGPSVVHIMAQAKISNVAAAGGALGQWKIPHDGQGSGFVVDHQGHIVTNFHVIDGAEEIEILLSDGRRVLARLVGQDRETDLALLKVDADGLIPAEWGDSEQADVGSFVWAVGSPFGLQRSVTSGIISGKHRTGMSRSPYQDFLQTDAAVNPGNSGGPLVDTQGRVIGVNTAIVGDSYQGISFAIPSHIARQIITGLKEKGLVTRGWLGVELAEVDSGVASSTAAVPPKGAVVLRVINLPDQRSPASIAGIQEGDIVLKWDERDVENPAVLRQFVAETPIGHRVKTTVLRAGQRMELEIAVGQRPGQL
ncbi:S1C family serine protease [Anatilimnocola floriformis]|uniref:S1C family serine protease n=1 Tax=Anatilimnocola floriformis TaxID=2948575 RepID=UPI0020C211B2|nr:trypsin-like peptidase domain-containing protein [Anatilimnocola floriformis]